MTRARATQKKNRWRALLIFVVLCAAVVGGYQWISNSDTFADTPSSPSAAPDDAGASADPTKPPAVSEEPSEGPSDAPTDAPPADSPVPSDDARPVNADGIPVAANAESVTALINKQNALPDEYDPDDLVYPDVPFIFSEKIEKRKMRKEAAEALETLFAGAKDDGVYLAGVSAYRSYSTQKALFQRYVEQDGYEKARTYSAVPGTSEHQTGLAIDVSGSDGKCAAEDCFGGTPEAEWLEKHAPEYGFIIRYPEGKDDITGYKYEPWHIRYVGAELAQELAENGQTLEEYYNAVPVNQ